MEEGFLRPSRGRQAAEWYIVIFGKEKEKAETVLEFVIVICYFSRELIYSVQEAVRIVN
jgi:hypothetical protein